MAKVIDIKCPNCTATIKFDSKLQKLKCEYCGSVFTPEQIRKLENYEKEIQEEGEDTKLISYNCDSCGAEIVCDEQESATFCPYCGNTAIMKNKVTGKFAPSRIIPFKRTKNDAIEAFKQVKKGKLFIPNDFNSLENIEKIRGIYIPFWLYETYVDGRIDAKCTKVRTWIAGDYQYTKTDFYDVVREGVIDFDQVPVDGSTRFDNDIMNTIEPFNYNELVEYSHGYLSGYLAEKYDLDKEQAKEDAERRSLNTAHKVFDKTMNSYATRVIKTDTLKAKYDEVEYVLLPVYLLNIKYKDKMYTFAMNGQTGKFVGDVPINKTKALLYTILFFIVGFLLAYLFHYIFGGTTL